ncbi:hypothetical protein [Paraclostridium dentum]|uniref:hypothetical protein n=1 Tax=Paraclostridium dentum TaxID=2662455 RepID=UPI003F3020F0
MALQPYSFSSREVLQPGANGAAFKNNGIPGHRNNDDRINRTNNALLMNEHDVLNIKYAMDPRLKSMFRYGWAYGYNQIVMPKGRLVAADPYLTVMDTDTMHYFNALTLANGGKDVELDITKGFATWKEAAKAFEVDFDGKDKTNKETVRPANVPLGIMGRNEYTRDADAFNGIMPGPIHTDALLDMPWFVDADSAEANPWGSVIGAVKPGDLVKSDLNGRIVISPLSTDAVESMSIAEYERERQQVVGTIYATDKSLLPEGAARFAQWALDDRKKFNDFNPMIWPNSNRAGEDFVTNPPTMLQSEFTYPGYPYEKNYISNDLHMLASSREGALDPRLDESMRLDRGIPGLTDGANAVKKEYGTGETLTITHLVAADSLEGAQEMMIRLPETNLESAKIKIGNSAAVSIVANAVVGKFTIQYVDLHKGLISVIQTGTGTGESLPVNVSYVKRGMAGVPTYLDWDGCQGTVSVLLQK